MHYYRFRKLNDRYVKGILYCLLIGFYLNFIKNFSPLVTWYISFVYSSVLLTQQDFPYICQKVSSCFFYFYFFWVSWLVKFHKEEEIECFLKNWFPIVVWILANALLRLLTNMNQKISNHFLCLQSFWSSLITGEMNERLQEISRDLITTEYAEICQKLVGIFCCTDLLRSEIWTSVMTSICKF